MKRRVQLGVIGSAGDITQSARLTQTAEQVGECIAESGAILVFGAEKDCITLPTIAAMRARAFGGFTIGITYGSSLSIHTPESADAVIASGIDRGGGREAALCYSSNAIICMNGGAGTLTEMAIAYQNRTPLVGIVGSGGWTDKMVDNYMDHRERVLIEPAESAEEAVAIALRLALERRYGDR